MLDPIGGFRRIRDFYITYLETAFRFRNDELQEERRRLLETPGTLCTQPLFEPLPDYKKSGFRIDQFRGDEEHLPGFTAAEREAFVDLAMAGLFPTQEVGGERIGSFELFSHQVEMLKRGVQPGTPGIVTSGTGSGKTESFLLPIFASLAREALKWSAPATGYLQNRWWHDENGVPYEKLQAIPGELRPLKANPEATPFVAHRRGETRPAAIRAMVLYPMNALVEDQMVRLRLALDSDPAREVMDRLFDGNRIFLGRYTSAAPVTGFDVHPRLPADSKEELGRRRRKLGDLLDAVKQMELVQKYVRDADKSEFDLDPRFLFGSVDGNELVTRWDMQMTPPDIFITNTSMLNAILAREVDAPIIEQTRDWITTHDDAYFYLVIDELHLQRGSSGTEVAYLLRLLLQRLGLTQPEHRHKLRILASSASLPTEPVEKRDQSLEYLWDFFGSNGLRKSATDTTTYDAQSWLPAIRPGEALPATPAGDGTLDPEPFRAFVDAHDEVNPGLPDERPTEWSAVAAALGVASNGPKASAAAAIAEVGQRLAQACWDDELRGARATDVARLAKTLFDIEADEESESWVEVEKAVRGVLLVRGCGDQWKAWYGDESAPEAPRFRMHTFFRSVEGVFAPVIGGERALGQLGVERGVRYLSKENGADPTLAPRLFESLYCESCGEVFVGGRREARDNGDVELVPNSPELEGLPDKAAMGYFEDLSYNDFAVFWPTTSAECQASENDYSAGKDAPNEAPWTRAWLDPLTGRVRLHAGPRDQAKEGELPGYLHVWLFDKRRRKKQDNHERTKSTRGTAVPYACPSCGMDYGRRSRNFRLSPLRSFRAGFAKTTQLLASELFSLQRESTPSPKLVSFSDSRQDAAKAALDIERRHHEDVRREILLRVVQAAMPDVGALRTELEQLEAAAQNPVVAAALKPQIDALRGQLESAGDGVVRLDTVMESPEQIGGKFSGVAGDRDPLKPLLQAFVAAGIHPADAAGVARVGPSKFDWMSLFRFDEEQGRWDWADVIVRDDGKQRPLGEVNDARAALVKQAVSNMTEVIFNRTYFALEEAGLAYPVAVGGFANEDDQGLATALLRVFADGYRYEHSPWGDSDKKPWSDVDDIHPNTKVRKYANKLVGRGADGWLGNALRLMELGGHRFGFIHTDKVGLKLVEPTDPVWRCAACQRVHLHRGFGACTRCAADLSTERTEDVADIRKGNYLAKRLAMRTKGGEPFRLHCEELTGQTEDPADRQRKFRDIIIKELDGSYAQKEKIDLLAVTTTMEVGIDIGSLQSVFQANMPPQRFNYQQRVGRAGRRGQAFSTALTVCRSKSHDLHYFRTPSAITGDPPPSPFLSKSLDAPAERFVTKVWLWHAFGILRQRFPTPYPGDYLRPPDIHGEFVPRKDYFEPDSVWPERLLDVLEETTDFRDEVIATLLGDSKIDPEPLRYSPEEMRARINSIREIAPQPGLAHSLAEAGRLPMYGMPTRARDLYVSARKDPDSKRLEFGTIDRDLDVAIHEFAPGSILVKDKKEHRCVGFTGPLPEPGLWNKQTEVIPHDDAFGERFWLFNCACGASRRAGERELDPGTVCAACGDPLSTPGYQCRVPSGFRTDLRARAIQGDYERGNRHRSIVAEGEEPRFQPTSTNLRYWVHPQSQLYRLNRGPTTDDGNEFLGYSGSVYEQSIVGGAAKLMAQHLAHQYVSDDRDDLRLVDEKEFDKIWLAAPKTTDSLFLSPAEVRVDLRVAEVGRGDGADIAVRAAALSATFLFVDRAAQELDIDPGEFEVLEPRTIRTGDRLPQPMIQIADELVNGAGFCERLGDDSGGEPLALELVQSIVRDPDKYPLSRLFEGDHAAECDQSCYRCMQRYDNQGYHGLLDWRLGLAFLASMLDTGFDCGLDGNFTSHAFLADWPELAERYVEEMLRRFPGRRIDAGALPAFQFGARPDVVAVAVHPLWDTEYAESGVITQARDLARAHGTPHFVNTFELARRPIRVRDMILRSSS